MTAPLAKATPACSERFGPVSACMGTPPPGWEPGMRPPCLACGAASGEPCRPAGLAKAAAVALRALAEQMRACEYPCMCPLFCVFCRMTVDARREAVTALEALRDALPVGSGPWGQARAQASLVEHATPETLDAWATAWDAWAEAQP